MSKPLIIATPDPVKNLAAHMKKESNNQSCTSCITSGYFPNSVIINLVNTPNTLRLKKTKINYISSFVEKERATHHWSLLLKTTKHHVGEKKYLSEHY